MKTLELFSGTGSFSNVAKERGHEIFRVDINLDFECELYGDLNNLTIFNLVPEEVNIVWNSPPCDTFSVASIGKHWNKDHTPKTKEALKGLELLETNIFFISRLLLRNKNLVWFIENPRGKMRKIIDPILQKYGLTDYVRNTVTYCQYGDTRMKPTDIWTNLKKWKPRPICKNGDPCHVSAPRGSVSGTQGIKGKINRGVIPKNLFIEIFEVLENETKN